MTRGLRCVALLLLCGALGACGGGDDSTPECSMDNPAVLAPSSWPKFRHDRQNTGAVANAALAANPGRLRWVFPPLDQPPKRSFAASPALNAGESLIYIGSNDGFVYAVNTADGTPSTTFSFNAGAPITATALLAVRDGGDAIFVGAGNGILYGLTSTGAAQATFWNPAPGGYLSAAPNIGGDGTVFATSLGGVVVGVCPNGIDRFLLSVASVQSSPALDASGTLYFGGDDHLLRAVGYNYHYNAALQFWSVSASAAIVTAPVIDLQTNSVYISDVGGHVYKVLIAKGGPDPGFQFAPAVGAIHSSPALAGGRLYFGSDDGNLYAVDKLSGQLAWAFPTGAPIFSSPAVATNGAQAPIVVVGSDDGHVYFVRDDGTRATQLIAYPIGAQVRSSPAIGSDGTVYIGADDGRVYAIGTPLS
ncbi:MAG: PQQ-binding-like beta-propeller repeat protein [Candidatus Binatia bacterium]